MNPTRALIEFCQVLRGLGVRVSTQEALDAASALAHLDWSQRADFRTCLQATLIKREEDLPLFQEAFSAYFRPSPGPRSPSPTPGGQGPGEETEFLFQGKPLDIPEDLKQVHQKLAPEDQQRILDFLDRTSSGNKVTDKLQAITERMVMGSLEYWRRQLAEQEIQNFQVDYTGNPRIDGALEASTEALQSSLPALMERDLKRITESEVPQVLRLMKRMAKALATQLSRRRKRSRATQQVDLRRTIRGNLRYGGTLLKVSYRQRSRTKPKILLLCDVSGSMIRYVAFVLQFLFSVANLAYNIESFIFAEELERLTPTFRSKPTLKEVMDTIMTRSAQWGKGTHLHQSLVTMKTRHRRVLQPATVVVILSDTKTLHAEAAAEELALLGRSVKKIIWLNTMPREEWPRHRTVELFRKHAQMFPCNTLSDLAKVVGSEVFHSMA